MKKLVFATLMCVAAMRAKAQVLTSETVNNVYKEMTNKSKSDYAYNAERTGNDITAMYVYKQVKGAKGDVTLKPHRKYEYKYAADGTVAELESSQPVVFGADAMVGTPTHPIVLKKVASHDAIHSPTLPSSALRPQRYTVSGQRHTSTWRGISIEKRADGSVRKGIEK